MALIVNRVLGKPLKGGLVMFSESDLPRGRTQRPLATVDAVVPIVAGLTTWDFIYALNFPCELLLGIGPDRAQPPQTIANRCIGGIA